MATFKFIEAKGENVKALQAALNGIDAEVQRKQEDIQAIAESIQMMMSEPDSQLGGCGSIGWLVWSRACRSSV